MRGEGEGASLRMSIPFNKPYITGKEMDYVGHSVKSGRFYGDGIFSKKCQEIIERKFGAKKVLLTTSCTSALEMSGLLCGIGAEDEVIVPSYTFVSSASAFYIWGAKPVFVDIRSDNFNIDETKIEEAVTERTKAIVPVHYGGVACEMDTIINIARRYGLFVIEDAAQGFNSMYNGRYLGTIGDFGAYSFHGTKDYVCGEGGAIVINDEEYEEAAEIIREKGTNRTARFRNGKDKYTWVNVGSSFLPSDLLAAFLLAQLESMDFILERRCNLFDRYMEALRPLANEGVMSISAVSESSRGNGHMFFIVLENAEARNGLVDYLASYGISAMAHYLPLHLSPVGKKLGYKQGQLPVTEAMHSRILRLPLYCDMKDEEQSLVIKYVKSFFRG